MEEEDDDTDESDVDDNDDGDDNEVEQRGDILTVIRSVLVTF